MDTLAPFDFEIIGLNMIGWMDIEADYERYETKVIEISITQINKVILQIPIFLDIDCLSPQDKQIVQEFADRWVDDNWHDICREHAEANKAHHDDDY